MTTRTIQVRVILSQGLLCKRASATDLELMIDDEMCLEAWPHIKPDLVRLHSLAMVDCAGCFELWVSEIIR